MPTHYIILLFAVFSETIGTAALQASQQFTKFWPSVIVVIAYAVSFYLLAFALRTIPLGIAYALWSGLGIFFIGCIGFLVYGQKLDLPAVLGMGMILSGIIVIHLFSNTSTH
jgi:small multidrug resistance pump